MTIISDPDQYSRKEQLYIAVRRHEGRIYTDNQLRTLPDIAAAHQYAEEWAFRKRSLERLQQHIARTFGKTRINILHLGCGNGWMSNHLHQLGYNLTGVDLNLEELRQAERVFGSSVSLRWVYSDIFGQAFPADKFHVIVLAASCQYFVDIKLLTARLLQLLEPGGEIHLVDSMFYEDSELTKAQQRSLDYYSAIGYPEMSAWYHHHSMSAVKSLGFKRVLPALIRIFNGNRAPGWWALRR